MIEVKDLVFRYPKQNTDTLKKVSFKIEKGEVYGFLGPSGAGKSTTQKLLIRLLSTYQGTIKIMGQEISSFNNAYYNQIGVGFELPNHYPKLTGLENLKMFASFYDKPITKLNELLTRVGLYEDRNKPTSDYSKGMKMRLNFIRAIMHNPDIIFFDEPTSGLDPANAHQLKLIIKELQAQGKTIFLTTHNMHDADELCDRVAFITDGEIKAEGSPKSLKMQFGEPNVRVEYSSHTSQRNEFPLKGLGANSDFLNLLKHEKIKSIHSTEATLDEVFIKLTGTQLTQNHA